MPGWTDQFIGGAPAVPQIGANQINSIAQALSGAPMSMPATPIPVGQDFLSQAAANAPTSGYAPGIGQVPIGQPAASSGSAGMGSLSAPAGGMSTQTAISPPAAPAAINQAKPLSGSPAAGNWLNAMFRTMPPQYGGTGTSGLSSGAAPAHVLRPGLTGYARRGFR
jgi:hypothetical protein